MNNAGDAMNAVRDYFGEDNVSVTGLVLEREFYQKAIDVMLLVLVGLLGVAVLIALIGVANTLSLSVIERRRESATLRAVGMSKRQLRHSLGIEGMLIAGIGAFVGVLVGALYAWLGAQLLFGGFATPILRCESGTSSSLWLCRSELDCSPQLSLHAVQHAPPPLQRLQWNDALNCPQRTEGPHINQVWGPDAILVRASL